LLHNSLVYEEDKEFPVNEDYKMSSIDHARNRLTYFKSVKFLKNFSHSIFVPDLYHPSLFIEKKHNKDGPLKDFILRFEIRLPT